VVFCGLPACPDADEETPMSHTDTDPAASPAASPAATLARWLDDEQRVRATLGPPGVARPAQIALLSGLVWFASFIRG
jgi:hypothetical protein